MATPRPKPAHKRIKLDGESPALQTLFAKWEKLNEVANRERWTLDKTSDVVKALFVEAQTLAADEFTWFTTLVLIEGGFFLTVFCALDQLSPQDQSPVPGGMFL